MPVQRECAPAEGVLRGLQEDTGLCSWLNCTGWKPHDCQILSRARVVHMLSSGLGLLRQRGVRARWGSGRVRMIPVQLTAPLVARRLRGEGEKPYPSTDVVVVHCHEPLASLLLSIVTHFPIHAALRIFVYEMCAAPAGGLPKSPGHVWPQPWGFLLDVPVRRLALENRGFESAAYLKHIVDATEAGDLADVTLFLQSGWREHSPQMFM